jgi:carboxypeptidase Q
MTRPLLLALAIALASPVIAQTASPQVSELRDAALQDDYAWDIVEGLTTEVGPRLAGRKPKREPALGRSQG